MKNKIIKLTCAIWIPVMLVVIVVALLILSALDRAETKIARMHSKATVERQSNALARDFHHIILELISFADQAELKDLWDEDTAAARAAKSKLAEHYRNIIAHHHYYDQIRVLDEDGMEIVRVNYNSGRPSVAASQQLQNKKGRYYFDDAFSLAPGAILVSPLDLNMEHGKIELPLKPTIRFATPVIDSQGRKRGIVLLNYLGNEMLHSFISGADRDSGHLSMLLNSEGYWLKGPEAAVEWGFMYKERQRQSFAEIYPADWIQVNAATSAQFISDRGLITSTKIYPLQEASGTGSGPILRHSSTVRLPAADDYSWFIVHTIPKQVLYAQRDRRREGAALLVVMTGIVWMAGSFSLARAVTARRQAERSNREKERMYRTLFDNSLDAVLLIAGNGTIHSANPAACGMFGYTRVELCGMGWRDLLKKSLAEGPLPGEEPGHTGIFKGELSFLRKGREAFEGEVSCKFFEGNAGETMASMIIRDITRRKSNEAALNQRREQLSTAMRMARAGYWEYDVDNEAFTFNDHFFHMLRTTAGQAGGYTMSASEYARRYCHPEDVPVVAGEIERAIGTSAAAFSRQLEHRVIFGDGKVGHMEIRYSIVKDDDGRTVKIFGVNQDISERKRIEAELQESRDYLTTAIEALDEGFVIFDAEDRLVLCNKRYLEIYDKTGEFIKVGETFEDLTRQGVMRGYYADAVGREEE